MTKWKSTAEPKADADQEFDRLVSEVSAKLDSDQSVDLNALADEHPRHIGRLRKLLPTLEAMADLGHSIADANRAGASATEDHACTRGVLGDFRIIREVGRGGMGVVYEAEQLSLQRRVALKILPFAAVLDQRQLQRFKNESLAAAQLDHPNIVDVFAVGSDRGVHFYAMRYIEGLSFAQFIAELRRSEVGGERNGVGDERSELPGALRKSNALAEPGSPDLQPTVVYEKVPSRKTASEAQRPKSEIETGPIAALSTECSQNSPAYFRSVTQMGLQVAEALDNAHQQGIVHRDIKPSNLMLDASGKPWVTDFGLAHIETDVNLTMTGDLLGTFRYMSPEQALAKRIVVDHRTDIYSLGVTLYELLTLQPAFGGNDRQELLRQVAFEEPALPRRLNKEIPAELETIVLKAMAKNPAERYDTAQKLADDLERLLADQPILAKRPSPVIRIRKWVKRHKAVATTSTLSVVLILAVLSGSLVVRNQRLTRLRNTSQEAISAVERALAEQKYDLAIGRLTEVHSHLADAPTASTALMSMRRRVEQLLGDAEAQQRIQRFRQLVRKTRHYAYFDSKLREAKPLCEEALGLYNVLGLNTTREADPAQPGESLPVELRAEVFELLLILARVQTRVYEPRNEQGEQVALKNAMATLNQADGWRQGSPALYRRRAEIYKRLGDEQSELADQERANKADPVTALDHFLLGRSTAAADAFPHFMAALRVEPDHAPSFFQLGHLYRYHKKQAEQAELCYTACIALLPDEPMGYQFRAAVYQNLTGDPAKAVVDYTTSLRLEPDRWSVLELRGIAYDQMGRHQDAINDYTAAYKLVSADGLRAELCYNRGYAFLGLDQFADARADFDRAAKWVPRRFDNDVAWLYVAGPMELRDPQKALPLAQEAVKRQPENFAYLNTLGTVYYRLGQFDQALKTLQKGIQLDENGGTAFDFFVLSMAHWRLGNPVATDHELTAEEQAQHKNEAHKWYRLAADWMDSNQPDDEELRSFRGEAEELLGMPEPVK